MSAFLQTIVGGILAILGGMAGMWFQAKNARRIKMIDAKRRDFRSNFLPKMTLSALEMGQFPD